jgi:hypothetical protein
MKNAKHFFKADKTGLVLGALIVITLTGCVAYVDGPRDRSYAGPTVIVAQDDYLYYPGYGVYYNGYRHQYAYLDGGAWVSRPAPRGVTVDVLLASPSVRMNFHDAPAQHHAETVRKYPKNWARPNSNQGQNERHDEHGRK